MKNRHSNKELLYLVGFLTLCTGAGFISLNESKIWARISWVVILLLAVYIIPKVKYKANQKAYLIVFSVCLLMSMFANDWPINVNYFQRIVILWLSCAVVLWIPYERFMDTYVKFMRFVAIFSLVCFVFAPIIRSLPLPSFSAGGGFYYKNLIFTVVSMTNTRNYGPFWEPGAYQLFLNWAIFYELRNPSKLQKKDIILFIITILTTRSTGGFIILFLILCYYPLSLSTGKASFKRMVLVAFLSIVVALGAYMTISSSLGQEVFSKVESLQESPDEKTSSNVSAYTRYYSTYASIEAIKKSPVFGVGINGLKSEIGDSYDLTSNTNSVLSMPASFGVLAGLLYIYLFVQCAFHKKRKLLPSVVFLIIIIAMFCTENLLASLIFWIFLFYESKQIEYAKLFSYQQLT